MNVFGETELLSSLWLYRASKDSLGLAVQNIDPTITRSIVFGLSPADGAVVEGMSCCVASMPR